MDPFDEMTPEPEFPDSDFERALMLQNLMISLATGGGADEKAFSALRKHFMNSAKTKRLLPSFVRSSRSLGEFWSYIKPKLATYAERRQYIHAEFQPILDHLEGTNRAPADASISEALASFDAEGVHAAWEKALERRTGDPEGAITMARTLLETVCKRILDDAGDKYDEGEELPKLYQMTAERLSLAPSQHAEEAFKRILGSCQNVVNTLGTLRNKIGDAHGRGGKPVKVKPRHAALAVNLAGSMATFLVETWNATKTGS